MAKEKKEKREKSKVRKVFDWIITVVFASLFIVVAVFQISSITSKNKNYGVPSVAGYQTLVILTDSMEPEYKVGGAVIVKKVKPSTLKVGDDITFYYSPWQTYMANPIVTHRIIEINIDESKEEGQGKYQFVVHGINTDSDNCSSTSSGNRDCTDQTQVFDETKVLGKVIGYSFVIGGIFKFMTSIWGLIIILLVPALYLILTSVLDIFKAATMEEEKAKEVIDNGTSIDGLSEKEKERLKQELLEELVSSKENNKDDKNE